MGAGSLATGGSLGIIFILLFIGLVSGLNNIGKLSKTVEFRAGLKEQKYRITLLWWIGITAIAIIAFFVSAIYFPVRTAGSSDTNQNTNQVVSQSWITYTAEVNKGNFTASLPTQPTFSTDSQILTNTNISAIADTYESTGSDGASYTVDYIHYDGKVDLSDRKTVLKNVLDGMVANSANNTLVSSANELLSIVV